MTLRPAPLSTPPIDPAQELTGLDKIVEVITLLVLKFGRATSALLVVGGLLILCLITLVISMAQSMILRNDMQGLLDRQELLIRAQARLERTTVSTQEVLADTLTKVSATQARVETVAESTPKIKVDKKGRPKLVLQKAVSSAAPPVVSSPPPIVPAAKEVEVPLPITE